MKQPKISATWCPFVTGAARWADGPKHSQLFHVSSAFKLDTLASGLYTYLRHIVINSIPEISGSYLLTSDGFLGVSFS